MHDPVVGQVYIVCYLVLGIFGVPANLIAIVIFARGKCGLSKCITRYLVAMAATDLFVVFTNVIVNRIFSVYYPSSFLSITPACSIKTVLLNAGKDSSVWLTVAFTCDRCVAICSQNLRNKYCTGRTARVVIVLVCVVSGLRNMPWYFSIKPLYFVNDVPWYCTFKSDFFSSNAWIAFALINLVGAPFVPLFLILLFNALTIRHILLSSRARRALRGKKGAEQDRDVEMENRKQSIVLLLAISANFIVLWLTFVAHYATVRITGNFFYSSSSPMFAFQEAGYMLLLLSCSTNTCIYAVIQNKFREEMRYLVLYPFQYLANTFKLS
ncbi:putative G-protein coupled receptor 139 [Rhinoraja longicauda]